MFQRLLGEFPLSAEELENVFDTLDTDGNGYLTPEEFSSGFSGSLYYQSDKEKLFCILILNKKYSKSSFSVFMSFVFTVLSCYCYYYPEQSD